MIEEIYSYFTIEMIYLWLNIGVLPFWLLLIFFPQTKLCKIFTTSIFPIFIFSLIYVYLFYVIFNNGYNFLDNFNLYLGLESLRELFNETGFLIIFWVHFIAINLFCGSWIVNDSRKLSISKIIVFITLIITYFTGPLGVFVYWIIRIFFAKRISLYN